MKTAIEVLIYTPQELNHASYIQTGLFELEHRGFLKCRVVLDVQARRGRIATDTGIPVYTRHPQPKTSFYKLIDHANQREIDFACDLYDAPWYFSDIALKSCDFVFKRNFENRYIEPFEKTVKEKIYPLGMSFMLQSPHKHGGLKFLFALLITNSVLTLKKDRKLVKKIYFSILANWRHFKQFQSTRTYGDFNFYDTAPINKQIFYLKRLFPRENDLDTKEVHLQRVSIIRQLREKLGKNFIGGLKPDKLAKELYPDCITMLPTDQHSFLNILRSSAIAVYTRGLSNSVGWTLPEFLAQGKCIVAEPLTAELPAPLEHGKHLMYFRSPEECAEICEWLLERPEKMQELSRNARAYYEAHVDPAANVERIIRIMLNSAGL